MEKNKNLLNQSGCLNREAALAWVEDRLSPAERTLIEKHLRECILCREALEGFDSHDALRVRTAFADINTNMQQRLLHQEKRGLSRQMKLSLAAAVLVILIGVFSVFKFRTVEKPLVIAQDIKQPKFEEKAPAPVFADEVQETPARKKPNAASSPSKEKITAEDNTSKSAVEIPAQAAEPVAETQAAAAAEHKGEKPAEETEAIAYNTPTAKKSSEPAAAKSVRFAEKAIAVEYKNNNTESTYYEVQEPARFQGGDISRFRAYVEGLYASAAKEKGVSSSGNLSVSFIVDKTGKVRDVFVVKGLEAKTDSIVKGIVESSPVWQPGRQQGKAVNVNMVVEVAVNSK